MKKLILLLFATLLMGSISSLKAQCYGTVNYDVSVNAAGATTYSITTAHANELIMIAYDGWMGPGSGPITVDGNPATHIGTAFVYYYAVAETYAYNAPSAGTHTIVCTEPPYNSPYYLNMAAAFYVTGSGSPISICNITFTASTVTCVGGGSVTATIATATPNGMIYDNFDNNNGQGGPFVDSWTGATFLNQQHIGNGIDVSQAYTPAPTIGTYTVTANSSANAGPCGGLALLVSDIPAPLCIPAGLSAVLTQTPPSCGQCNGVINIAVSGGTPPYKYAWTPNVSTFNNVTGLCAGTYTCAVNDAACPAHDTTFVVVFPPYPFGLNATVIANEPCNGNCLGVANAAVTGGKTPYTYAWSPSGGNAATATGLCAGSYTITVMDASGCPGTAQVVITQPPVLSVTASATPALCNGQPSGTLSATAAGGTPPYVYSWSALNILAVGAGTYTVVAIDGNGCKATASATVTQPPPLTVKITGPQTVCKGASGILSANVNGGTGPYTYSWSPQTGTNATLIITPDSSTVYYVTVTDANGCTANPNPAEFSVVLGPPLTAALTGPTSMCVGTSVTLCTATTGGTGGNSFMWEPGGMTTPCVTVSPGGTTTYSETVSDNCGASVTVSAKVRVNPLPDVAFHADLYQGCSPMCVQFRNGTTIGSGGLASYVWNFGDKDTMYAYAPVHCYAKPGLYDVGLTAVSDSGCSSTLNKPGTITVYSSPVAFFKTNPNPANILSPTIQFSDKSTDQYGIVSWRWVFGEAGDTASVLENPIHTYGDTGTYCAQLAVMNMHGCSDTATDCLVINPAFSLYIPSAFTPNGLGKNEVFEAVGRYIKNFEMYIFDRWGTQVFYSNNINVGWDGTAKGGNICPEGTYVYKINVTDAQDLTHSYVGEVTLIK